MSTSSIWPKADEYDERTALASVIWSYQPPSLTAPITGPQSIAMADAVLAAGWGNLEHFRHVTTNTLGMCMVHELDDPDLGYDKGIADAMDIVNGSEGGGSIEEWERKYYPSDSVTDVHACAKCGHADRQHPSPDCEWWTDSTRTDPPNGEHAPFELQGGDLHGFRFCQACRKTWPCGEAS